jgi:hypothetical protein
MISNTICIYILVGSRLVHIFTHPVPSDSYDNLKSEDDQGALEQPYVKIDENN